jgi:LCP family protein required for cell wall assembly
MRFLPRTRGGLLWRAMLASILVIGFAAGATAVAGLLQVGNLANELGINSSNIKGLTLPAPGKPETILIIGSDHREGEGSAASYMNAESDTMLLVRLDDASSTINVMSVPRDLAVLNAAGGTVKLNSIYSTEDGPAGILKVLKAQVFPNLKVNHVVDTSFIGFSDLIDAIGCVYTDVDRRYYNVTEPAPSPDNFSSINIQPGYQKLCGGVHSATGTNSALAFVRYRHTDSDVVRNARQQDFIRWAKDGYSTTQLAENEGKLVKIFSQNTKTDRSLATTKGLLDLFGIVLDANSSTLKTVQFPEYFGTTAAGAPSFVYPCPELSNCSTGYGGTDNAIGQPTEATEAIWKQFVTPVKAKAQSTSSAPAATRKTGHRRYKLNLSQVTADPGDGASQAAALGDVGFPIFYPKDIYNSYQGTPGVGYCFSFSANCDLTALEPESAYSSSYPRRYDIVGPGNRSYRSYVMTIDINSGVGEYYTVQGTTWKNPPILNRPSKVITVNRHRLYEYDDGGKVSLVATKTGSGVYWISNTLDNAIPNPAMIAMAAELTRARVKG